MTNKKKVVLFVGLIILGQVSFYVSFLAFYESWIPYYYIKFLPYIVPLIGVALLIAPLPLARFRLTEKSLRIGYYKSFIYFNLLIVILCVAVFAYMLNSGFWLVDPGFYKIVPVGT